MKLWMLIKILIKKFFSGEIEKLSEPEKIDNSFSYKIQRRDIDTNNHVNNLKYLDYTSRNDFATGSTQAGASLKHLSINSLDIGLAMLAMHSGVELIGIKDPYFLYQALKAFYNTDYNFKDNKIIFK